MDIDDARRTSFDRIAGAYDAVRPSYPEAVIDDILERSQAVTAVEVGAGTGKATVAFARCGLSVHALEPGHQMAEVLRSNTVGLPVTVEETTFEDFTGTDFDLVYAAQAWHWVQPAARYPKAHAVLRPGGSFALLTNEKAAIEPSLRVELDAAYARHFGWPAWDSEHLTKTVATWSAEIEASGLFRDLEVIHVPWTHTYTSEQYTALIDTYSDHHVKPEATRTACYADIRAAIDRRGGRIEIPYVTLAFFAVRSD